MGRGTLIIANRGSFNVIVFIVLPAQSWANSFYADGGIPPQQGQFVYRQHSSAMVVDNPGVLTGDELFGCRRPRQEISAGRSSIVYLSSSSRASLPVARRILGLIDRLK